MHIASYSSASTVRSSAICNHTSAEALANPTMMLSSTRSLNRFTAHRHAVPAVRLHVCRVKTQSVELDVGMQAPDFELSEPLTGKKVKLSEYAAGSPALVMFICNHCPYVVHLKEAIVSLTNEYAAKGFKSIAISSNSPVTHPKDAPELMAEDAKNYGYSFPYLFDETQEVAKAYYAACTPEFYVLDASHKLAYHGQFDDSRPRVENPAPVTGKDLRAAMDAVLAGQPAPRSRPSIGCNIKWTPGNEPEYFGAQVVKSS